MDGISKELHRGMLWYRQGRLDEATAHYEAILGAAPQCADAWYALGIIALTRKEHDRALELVSRALELSPDNPPVHQHIAVIYGRLGDFDAAARHYREAIRLAPHYAEAFFNLSRIVKFEPGDPLIAKIESRLENNATTDPDRCFLHFAAGKYYDDIGQPDKAFAHYRDANAARKARFDCESTKQQFENIAATFTTGWLRDNADRGNSSRLPVFVVGMPRSGTSLVEQILSSHPDVAAGGELYDIWEIVQAITRCDVLQRPFPRCLEGIKPGVIDKLADSYVERLSRLAPGAGRVTNKNPSDFRYLGLIATMFPHARILEVCRDPRDTCLSCYFQNFRNGHEYSFDLGAVGTYYRYYERLMQHWRSLIPSQLQSVDYEALVTEPEPIVRGMLDFCGLDWHPDCLDPHKTRGTVATASRWQVRQPIHRDSLSRWKRYEAHIGPLLDALGPIPERPESNNE